MNIKDALIQIKKCYFNKHGIRVAKEKFYKYLFIKPDKETFCHFEEH